MAALTDDFPLLNKLLTERARETVLVVAAILLAVNAFAFLHAIATSRDLVTVYGPVVGGDFTAFHTAATAAAAGDGAAIYDRFDFFRRLKEAFPTAGEILLTWQYPPTYYFAILPLAFLPYGAAYGLWLVAGAGAAFLLVRARGLGYPALFVLLAAPSTLHAAITGQNGFFTATLLLAAALYADRRPVVAGLCAALLTMKPQLGVLLPIAFLAGGCWRAFFTAAAGTLLLAGASVLAFGAETWAAFLNGLSTAAGHVADGSLPLDKMATPYSAALLAGAPQPIALAVYGLFALAAAIGTALLWRRSADPELRAAGLAAGVFFASPYAYYYEFVILALPMALLARRAASGGWLKHEKALLAAVFILPLYLLSVADASTLSAGFCILLLAAFSILRRIAQEQPAVFQLRALFRNR
jgi:hypothetical protein